MGARIQSKTPFTTATQFHATHDLVFTSLSFFYVMQPNTISSDEARHLLKEQLDELLQNLFELSVIVYDFQPDGNKLVWKKM